MPSQSVVIHFQTGEFCVIDDTTQQEFQHFDFVKALPSGYTLSYSNNHNDNNFDPNKRRSERVDVSNFFLLQRSVSESEINTASLLSDDSNNNNNNIAKISTLNKNKLDKTVCLAKDRISNELVILKPIHLKGEQHFQELVQQITKLKALSRHFQVVRVHKVLRVIPHIPLTNSLEVFNYVPSSPKTPSSPSFEHSPTHSTSVSSPNLYSHALQYNSNVKPMAIVVLDYFPRGNELDENVIPPIGTIADELLLKSSYKYLSSHNILIEYEQSGLHRFYLNHFSFLRKNVSDGSGMNSNVSSILINESDEVEESIYANDNDNLLFPAPPETLFEGITQTDERYIIGCLLYQLILCKTFFFNREERERLVKIGKRDALDYLEVKRELEEYLENKEFVDLEELKETKKKKKEIEAEVALLEEDAKQLVEIVLQLLLDEPTKRPDLNEIAEYEIVKKYKSILDTQYEEKLKQYKQQLENDLFIVEQKKEEIKQSNNNSQINEKDLISIQYFLFNHKEKGFDERWDGNFFRQEKIGSESIISVLEMSTNISLKSFVLSFIRNLRMNVLYDFKQEINLPHDYKMLKLLGLNLMSFRNKKKSNVTFKHVRSIMGYSLPLVPEISLLIVLLLSIELLLNYNYEEYSTNPLEYQNKELLFQEVQCIQIELDDLIKKNEIDPSQFRAATKLTKKEAEVRFFIQTQTIPLAQKLIKSLLQEKQRGNLVLSLFKYIVNNCFQKEHKWVVIAGNKKSGEKMFGFEDIYQNKKKRNRGSLNFEQKGDYLSAESNVQIQLAFSKYGDKEVVFSDKINKINDKCKIQRRIFLISDIAIYNIDQSGPKLQVKRRVPIDEIESIYVSTYTDGFFVLRCPSSYDFMYSSWRKTEILCHILKIKNMPIKISNRFFFNPNKGDEREVVFVEDTKALKTNVKLQKKEYLVSIRPAESEPINIESVSVMILDEGKEEYEVLLDPYDITTLKIPASASYRIRFVFYVNENLNLFLDEFIKSDNETVFQLPLGVFNKREEKVVLLTDYRKVKQFIGKKNKQNNCTMKILDTGKHEVACVQFVYEYEY
ncbi:hypothetical protein ABK040_012754 [Willaertia magna]